MKTAETQVLTIPSKEILRRQLDEALAQIVLYTPKEQKKRKAELKKLKQKMGLEKFQEYLLEQAGL